MEMWLNVYFCYVICLNYVGLLGEVKLPEDIMPYDNHNSVCYGPGTHGQFRPSCSNTDYVIAVQSLNVGAKPLAMGCPSSVTKWTNHTGSYLVDHMDISELLDETSCCFPDEANDCISKYDYEHSGLDYFYHISSSGYTQSKPYMEVSWQKTTCNGTSEYPSGSHYMFMKYYCIERTRIGNMCSNKTYNTTGGAFYLTNTDYPNSVASTVFICQCHVQTNGSNIQVLTIDSSLVKQGNECKQEINVSDSNGVNTWDCESAPRFHITKVSKNRAATVTFKNTLWENGGQFWFGFYAEGIQSEMLQIDCSFQTKQVSAMSTSTSALFTSTLQNTENPSTIHTDPTTIKSTENPSTILTSTLQSTQSPSIIYTAILQSTESPYIIYTTTLKSTESPSTVHTTTLQSVSIKHTQILKNSKSLSTRHTAASHDINSTSTSHTDTLDSGKLTTPLSMSTLKTTKSLSTMHTPTFQSSESTLTIRRTLLQTTDESTMLLQSSTAKLSVKESRSSTQSTDTLLNQFNINVEDKDIGTLVIILEVIVAFLSIVLIVVGHIVWKPRCKKGNQVGDEERGSSGTNENSTTRATQPLSTRDEGQNGNQVGYVEKGSSGTNENSTTRATQPLSTRNVGQNRDRDLLKIAAAGDETPTRNRISTQTQIRPGKLKKRKRKRVTFLPYKRLSKNKRKGSTK